MRSDVNFQISRAGLSHPARVLTNQIACFTVVIIHLMCAPEGNSEFCFPESLNVS